MKTLLTIAAVGALAGVIVRRWRKAGRDEYTFDTERWDRLNRTIHGGDV